MEISDFPLPDEALQRAAEVIPTGKAGGWVDLFAERTETLRADWDEAGGLRILPGVREGWAIRSVAASHQAHRAVEGLDSERLLASCRAGFHRPPALGPASPTLEGFPWALREREEAVALTVRSLAEDLSHRIPGSIVFSLSLHWRRRSIRVASPGGRVRSDRTTRALLTLRLLSAADEFLVGVGAPDLDLLLTRHPGESLGREAAAFLESEGDRSEAPEGERVVVLGPGTGGVFFHEACGHALEGDLVLKNASVFRDFRGRRVAAEFVGAMDDSSQPGLEGSYVCDDEGSPGRGTVLIARGVLKAFLTDRTTGGCLEKGTTGNGRRESFRDLPLPRMSNTFLMAGTADPEEIVRETAEGIYVERLDGGRTDTASGDFLFRASAGRRIEGGRLTAPLRPFSLVGNGLLALRSLDRVGSDLSFGTGSGSCGKEGQQIPVAVGQPTIRLRSIYVRPG